MLRSVAAAAAAAKSLQLCPTLCNPRDGSPPGSPIPGDFRKYHSKHKQAKKKQFFPRNIFWRTF